MTIHDLVSMCCNNKSRRFLSTNTKSPACKLQKISSKSLSDINNLSTKNLLTNIKNELFSSSAKNACRPTTHARKLIVMQFDMVSKCKLHSVVTRLELVGCAQNLIKQNIFMLYMQFSINKTTKNCLFNQNSSPLFLFLFSPRLLTQKSSFNKFETLQQKSMNKTGESVSFYFLL